MHFFLKLIPCRPTFVKDMTPEERAIMQQHVAYWTEVMKQGKVHVFGPVFDPASVYGIGVVSMDDEAEVKDFVARDPASKINRYEIYQMRATLPS